MHNGCIFGFAGSGRNDRGKTAFFRGVPGGQCFGDGAALVGLQQHGIGGPNPSGLPDTAGVADQEIVADDLHTAANLGGEGAKPLRIVLCQRVLDRQDGIAGNPPG